MGIRVVAFLLAVFLFHGVWRFVAAGVALVVPYFAVVFANGGREPDNAARFETYRPRLPTRQADPGASSGSFTSGDSMAPAGEAGTVGADIADADIADADIADADVGEANIGEGDIGQGDIGQGDIGQGDAGHGTEHGAT